jgi:hypothetical protein
MTRPRVHIFWLPEAMTHRIVWMILGSALVACGKSVPADVDEAVKRSLPLAVKVAEDAVKLCPAQRPNAPFNNPPANTPPPPSPAAGTALDSDPQVVDVFVMCSFPDPRSPNTSAGTGLQSLRKTSQVPARAVTMPGDMAENTCAKSPKSCQQIIVPSRVVAEEKSADIRVVRPLADGGEVEVRVILKPK